MDANGLQFWMLAEREDWLLPGEARYDAARRALLLASRRALSVEEDAAAAAALLDAVPQASDGYGSLAYWQAPAIRVRGPASGTLQLAAPPSAPSDLAVGHDGVLYVALAGAVQLIDLRTRWAPLRVAAPGFSATRLAATPDAVWVLDRAGGKLARLSGLPLPNQPGPVAPGVFRPDPENPHPPRLDVQELGLGAGEPVAIAASARGRIALLVWTDDGAELRTLEAGEPSPALALEGVQRPYTLAWIGEDRLALRVTGLTEAVVYELGADGAAHLVGDYYPLPGAVAGPFAHALAGAPLYPIAVDDARPLHRLSLPQLARQARVPGARSFDGGVTDFAWHRLYLEASVPDGTGVTVWLAASNEPAPALPEAAWQPHTFGGAGEAGAPHGAWVPVRSELPFHAGLLACPALPGRAGLFTALVQRRERRVRTLRGRFLHLRVDLAGDGRATPEIGALRVWGPRFSYAQRYLPELYREQLFPPDADEVARATPADFLERTLANFEGILTPLEDRIAHAHVLTDPRTAPAEALDWLAGWLGVALDPALPEARRRAMVAHASELSRSRGTPRGLALALDVATGGAIQRGEIAVVEDWRLRRTFATVLGADLADELDPLTAGLAVSGNSFVGDTLILGSEERREFLALFELELGPRDQAAVDAFFERLAHRVTVLVQREQGADLLALTRKVAALEAPAHVAVRVFAASHPLVVGVSSLVGVDTYLARRCGPRTARIDASQIGQRDLVAAPPALDPRVEGDPA